MGINKIKVRYESHDNSEIELDKDLTVILGTNDHGKSGFNRAISWVALNNPKGDSMIPWEGPKRAHATLETESHIVTRSKGAGNTYVVDGMEFLTVGNNMPDEVSAALNIGQINIQRQVDQYFILSASAGEAAKQINALAGIEDSDKAIKRTNELIRESEKEIKEYDKAIKQNEAYIESFAVAVEKARDHLQRVIDLQTDIVTTEEDIIAAKTLQLALVDAVDKLRRYPEYETAAERIKESEQIQEKVAEQTNFCRNASDLCVRVRSVDLSKFDVLDEAGVSDMEVLAKTIQTDEINLAQKQALANSLRSVDLKKFNSCDTAGLKLAEIQEISRIETASANRLKLLAEAKRAQDEIDKLTDYLDICINELSNIEEQCPACGQTVRGRDASNHLHS